MQEAVQDEAADGEARRRAQRQETSRVLGVPQDVLEEGQTEGAPQVHTVWFINKVVKPHNENATVYWSIWVLQFSGFYWIFAGLLGFTRFLGFTGWQENY